jgi:hypothetical protein
MVLGGWGKTSGVEVGDTTERSDSIYAYAFSYAQYVRQATR